jgi:hypothetical protein
MTDSIGDARHAAKNAATAGDRGDFQRMTTEARLAAAYAQIAIAEGLERIVEQLDAIRDEVAVLR